MKSPLMLLPRIREVLFVLSLALCCGTGFADSILNENFDAGRASTSIASPWATQGGPGTATYDSLSVATGYCAKVTNSKSTAPIGNFQFNRPLSAAVKINSGDQIIWRFSLNVAPMSASAAAQTTVRLTGLNAAKQGVNVLALNVFPDHRVAVSTGSGVQSYFMSAANPANFFLINYSQWYDFEFQVNTATGLFSVSMKDHASCADVAVAKTALTVQNAVDIGTFDSFIGSQSSNNNTFYLDEILVVQAPPLPPSDSIAAANSNYYYFIPSQSGDRVFLTLRAWINVAATGSAKCLKIRVNGKAVGGDHLVSKPLTFQTRNGQEFEWCDVSSWKIWRLRYGTATPPATYPAEASPIGTGPSDIVTADSVLFTVDITDYLLADRTSRNILSFDNSSGNGLKFVDAAVTTGTWTMPPVIAYGTPPTGTIPTYPITPTISGTFNLSISSNGTLNITVNGQTYRFTSAFSYPNVIPNTAGKFNVIGDAASAAPFSSSESIWNPQVSEVVQGEHYRICALGASYRFVRDIQKNSNHVDITDTLTNFSGSNLGIAMRHECRFPSVPVTTMVAGMRLPTKNCAVTDCTQENPSVYVGSPNSGIGIIPRDDVMRVHSTKFVYTPNQAYNYTSYAPSGFGGLYDYRFALGNAADYESKWSIVPLANDDYWQFVKIVRDMVSANFPIPGCFSFAYTKSNFMGLTADKKAAYIANRGATCISSSPADWTSFRDANAYFSGTDVPPSLAQGTAIPCAPNWMLATQKMMADFKAAAKLVNPDLSIRQVLYFHCYLSSEVKSWTNYPDDRLLDANNNQYTFTGGAQPSDQIKERYYPIFYPWTDGTVSNSYAAKLESVLAGIVGNDGFDGVFWDEFSKSSVTEFYSPTVWDNHTGVFDFSNFNISKSSTNLNNLTLISQKWRLARVKILQDAGKMVVGNTEPYTETESAMSFPRVVETNPISNLARTNFYSPIGLGDILSKPTEDDLAQQIRRHLDNAALYYYYETGTVMTHPNLTSRMFPFTPIEIRPGVLIGSERILLSRPACVGWGDGVSMANCKIYIYDERGNEISNPEADVERDMNNGAPATGMTTVKLPLGYTAAIIRN